MPKTLEARILLGWMSEEQAVKYLTQECLFDPQIDEAGARTIWRQYADRVDSLCHARPVCCPQSRPLNAFERTHAQTFLAFAKQIGLGTVKDVVKIDPRSCVVHQLYVVTDRADDYAKRLTSASEWVNHCLRPSLPPPRNLKVQSAMNDVHVQVPHMEFSFGFDPRAGFQISEHPNYVTTSLFSGIDGSSRLLLWAGYHRSFARMASITDDATERSALTVLTTDSDFMVSPASPNHGLRDMICGSRPPFFADFFDDRFFMPVRLLRKRYELRVRAELVAVNDES